MSKAPARPARASISPSPTHSAEAERQRAEIDRIQQDIQVVSMRLSEAKGESFHVPDSSSHRAAASKDSAISPFVTGLRALADSSKGDAKLQCLQQLLEKVCEYDRVVLSKTAPPDTNTQGVPLRRKSLGADLYSLPSHLRIVDRLMDLHSQSKRVTVIRTTGEGGGSTPESKPSGEDSSRVDKALIDSLKSSLGKATIKLDEADKKRTAAETEVVKANLTISSLQAELAAARDQLQTRVSEDSAQLLELRAALNDREQELARAPAASELAALHEKLQQQRDAHASELADGLAALRAELDARDDQLAILRRDDSTLELRHLQRRLETEAATLQGVLRTLLSRAHGLRAHGQQQAVYDYSQLSEEFRNAFVSLDAAIAQHFQVLEQEKALLLSVKEMLETELSSSAMQRDLLQSDLAGLSGEHEALKAAYHALSFESAAQQRDLLMTHKQPAKDELATLKAEVAKLETQLAEATAAAQRPAQADLTSALSALEEQVRLLNQENVQLVSAVKSGKEEAAQYKQLVDKYRAKLKDLSTKNGGKDDNFMDSFEEVMQEEMLAMKAAFEAKLRAAREESDMLSRKHQVEIGRLQATRSPYSFFNGTPSLAALNVSAATTSASSGPTLTSQSSRK